MNIIKKLVVKVELQEELREINHKLKENKELIKALSRNLPNYSTMISLYKLEREQLLNRKHELITMLGLKSNTDSYSSESFRSASGMAR